MSTLQVYEHEEGRLYSYDRDGKVDIDVDETEEEAQESSAREKAVRKKIHKKLNN